MTRLLLILLLAGLLVTMSAGDARAGFLVPFVATFLSVSTAVASVIVAVGVTAVSIGANYLVQRLTQPDTPAEQVAAAETGPVGGVQLDMRADPDVSRSLLVGRACTAGSRIYCETYGMRGEIDNSDLIETRAFADHPCHGLVETYFKEQKVNLGPDEGSRGNSVGGYDGKLAIRFFDGSQSDPDSFAREFCGDHSERPYLASMTGRGVCYARVHQIYDTDLVPGLLAWRLVVDGIRLYDPRKDSTVGGSGSHRWGDLSTHRFTRNLPVIAYNILRGIRVRDHTGAARHFYGLENTPAAALPLSNWVAAMNEADIVLPGETEGQFWGGGEIPVSRPPMDALKELLKSCGGRLTEAGGVFKFHLGPPPLPVLSFDEGFLRANEGDTERPILPLESRVNHVTGSYTRPSDGWLTRVAPERFDAGAEARDGRRKSADMVCPMVQSGKQQQRVMQEALNRAQRGRSCRMPLPPAAFILEACDVIAFTAPERGYSAKLFEIDAAEKYSNGSVIASMTEIDPADFDIPPEAIEEEADGSFTVIRPAPKEVGDFSAQGVAVPGTNGTQRPAIRVNWADPQDGDVIAIEVQYRVLTEAGGEIAYASSGEPKAESLLILGVQPSTDYEVRARFRSFNGYATETSLWIAVTTPDTGISSAELDAATRARLSRLDQASDASIEKRLAAIFAGQDSIAQLAMGMFSQLDRQAQRYQIAAGARITRVDDAVQSETEARVSSIAALDAAVFNPETGLPALAGVVDGLIAEVGYDPETGVSALAQAFTNVFVSGDNGDAAAMVRLIAQDAPEGLAAQIALEVKAAGGVYGTESAALKLGVAPGLGSIVEAIADRFLFRGANGLFPLLSINSQTGIATFNSDVRFSGSAMIDGSLTVNKIKANEITADRIVSGEISQSYTAASDSSGSINRTSATVITVSGIEVDSRVSGLFIFGNLSGVLTDIQPQQYGFVLGQVGSSTTCKTGQYNFHALGGPNTGVDAPVVFSAFVPRSSLTNGTKTYAMSVTANNAAYQWSTPGRLTILALRA